MVKKIIFDTLTGCREDKLTVGFLLGYNHNMLFPVAPTEKGSIRENDEQNNIETINCVIRLET